MPSDENASVQYAILGFCLTAILMIIIIAVIKGGFVWGIWQFIIILLLASVGAVGGYFAGKMLS
jgi:heme/copper-type cytochrome/quinol oxidase subunit 4